MNDFFSKYLMYRKTDVQRFKAYIILHTRIIDPSPHINTVNLRPIFIENKKCNCKVVELFQVIFTFILGKKVTVARG